MTDTTLEHILTVVQGDPTIQAAYFFGSRSRGQGRPDSDWDIAVMLERELSERAIWKKRLELGALLSQDLSQELDLFVVGDSDLDLTFRIFRDGKRIYERERAKVTRARGPITQSLLRLSTFLRALPGQNRGVFSQSWIEH